MYTGPLGSSDCGVGKCWGGWILAEGIPRELYVAWLNDLLDDQKSGVVRGDLCGVLSGRGACMLFEREGGEFHIRQRIGYRESGFVYSFLESDSRLWMRAIDEGFVRLDPIHSSTGDRIVWVVVDRCGDPSRLLVAELPYSDQCLGEALRFALVLHARPGVGSGEMVPVADLPVWLDERLNDLMGHSSPLLLVAEEGSGVEELVSSFLERRFGLGHGSTLFYPGRLSGAVQLRELFGDSAGARLGGDGASVPIVARGGRAIVIQEAGDLAGIVQLRLLAHLTSSSERGQFWLFVTSRDLEAMVAAGEFLEGLYDILRGGAVVIPPVRACRDQIGREAERLIAEFRDRYGRSVELDPSAVDTLELYDWPGNWRELKNTLETAFLMCPGNRIQSSDLRLGQWDFMEESDDLNLRKRSRDLEKKLLLRAYALHGGNQVHMARALGISRGSLQYKMEKYGMLPGGSFDESAGD